MSRFSKKRVKITLAIIASTLSVGVLFQNCSKAGLQITDWDAVAAEAEAERLAIGADDELVTVGLNGVPDLKMFFVVDNSGTMSENQLNLSASFGAMFDNNSGSSLAKFDTTAYLFSTAQRSPSLSSEASLLDQLVSKQSAYSPLASFTQDKYATFRSATENSGAIPGDNIGFRISKIVSPLQYNFDVAPVLGAEAQADGSKKWSSAIRKIASADPAVMESEFKSRLAVLNAERIPLVQSGGKYQPENASIVDAESGLCAVARILRNPDSYIKSGDLFSFVIVSDENDNDPAGASCVQSYKKFTGNEDLVDGDCRKKETSISYKPEVVSTVASTCSYNGVQGYKYTVSHPISKDKTIINYRALATKAEYTTPLTNLTYKVKSTSYQYLNTYVTFYTQTCVDVVSDGIVTGKKCTVNQPSSKYKAGNFTSDCYGLAKSFDAGALNTAGYAPVCTTAYGSVSSCPAADYCKSSDSFTDRSINGILGTLSVSQCLDKAKTYSDFAAGTTPSCVSSSKTSTNVCSPDEANAGCKESKAATYSTVTVTADGDLTAVANGCLNYAKSQPNQAVTGSQDVTCSKSTVNETLAVSGNIPFSETASTDGGSTIAKGDCGAIKPLVIAKAKAANSQVVSSDACEVTGTYSLSKSKDPVTSDCQTQAQSYCSSNNLRSCSGTLVAGSSSTSTSGTASLFAKVSEVLSCSSLCGDSKFGACGAGAAASLTIEKFLQNKYGEKTACVVSTNDIATVGVKQTAILASNKDSVCQSTLEGIPTYFVSTNGPYRTSSTEVDYVAGSVKGSDGVTRPAKNLVDYIKSRSAELSQIRPIITTIVRTASDSLGVGGSAGTDYLKLVANSSDGQAASVLSKDYSVALQGLSKVLKEKMERSFILQKMKAHQIITAVYLIPRGSNSNGVLVPKSKWTQSGAMLNMANDLEFNDGDQFRIEFQNYIK